MTRTRATLIGFGAVLLWSLLALFTVGSTPTPPLLLNTLCFSIGGLLGLIWCAATGTLGALRNVPLRVYAFGIMGLFGYHALYFSALRLAPAAEAGLIAYLWPLLIVVFSGLLPGEKLRGGHIIGAVFGFAGAALIISNGAGSFQAQYLPGYILAMCCALTWSGYSLLSRRIGTAPTASVVVFCLGTAALSLPIHLMFEQTVLPKTGLGWASIIGLGLGPVGLAFYVWDIGVKRGDIQILGTSSYLAPLLSTLILVVTGVTPAKPVLFWAAVLITGGALCAARASYGKPGRTR
ncbi:aromatic amino acid exporter YddG [Roseobacter sp. GAI101]|uniref:aromatic amino acid exporter YddG n=1 Tax=Roseobacter sp. (strain GAI101) TaxID=391589 RepID=UPI0001872147|nr:EamA family transporter [Roseobacter sp. GAI101]EEB85054.1 permease, DMT superfamily [Roseobacter sp. GAI101]